MGTPPDSRGLDAEEVVRLLRELGISQDAIDSAVARGDPEGAVFEAVLLPGIAERTITAGEIASDGGLDVEQTGALMHAFGLAAPQADQPAFSPAEARAIVQLGRLQDVWPPELTVQLGRIYGRLLSRIAHASVELFRLHVGPDLARATGADRLTSLRAAQSAFSELAPLAEPLLVGVYRRWMEHELRQVAVREAEGRAAGHPLPGAVEVCLMFCDIKDFTAYADRAGDAAAVRLVERLSAVVTTERGQHARYTKGLGDGYMLVYGEAAEAVAAGVRIMEAMRVDDSAQGAPGPTPGVHASVHWGTAISREGDYFGGAVNLTARLLGAAGRNELVATAPVVASCGEGFGWQPAGTVVVRGVTQPVEVFRLRSPALPAPEFARGP